MITRLDNAMIIDGSGSPAFKGSVLYDQEKILKVERSQMNDNADRVIDCHQNFVTPGFIDLHSHGDFAAMNPKILEPKLNQGITTETCGMCGLGVAPMTKNLQADFRKQSVIGDQPGDWPWESFKEFRERLPKDLFPFVGHGVLRYLVAQNNPAPLNDSQLLELQSHLQRAFDDGAVGLTFGLIYLPALYADTRELKACIEVAAKNNKLVMAHVRSESDYLDEAVEEIAKLCRECGARFHLSHLKCIGQKNAKLLDNVFKLIDEYQFTFDHYPYNFGSTTLFSLLPPWLIKGTSPREIISNMYDHLPYLERLYGGLENISQYKNYGWDNLPYFCGWENIHVENEKINSAKDLLDVLKKYDGKVMMIDEYMDEELVERIMRHPSGMFGTDSLFVANPHPRVSGAYPKIIFDYVRKRNIITLEEAIAKMTSRSAKVLELQDRGLIEVGRLPHFVLIDKVKDELKIIK